MSCGDSHCLALTNSGMVYSWGGNSHRQLGYQGADSAIPQLIPLGDKRVAAISAGRSHSGVLTTGGIAYMFGSNRYGQLAVDRRTVFADTASPIVASELTPNEIERILCGSDLTVVVGHSTISNDEQSRAQQPAEEVRRQMPQLDIVDHRHRSSS